MTRRTIAKKIRLLGILLIIGAVLVVTPIGYYHLKARVEAASHPPTPVHSLVLKPTPTLVTGKPTHLNIPSLNMNLQVIDGVYNKQTKDWTLTLDKAQFALPSVQPNNEQGNTLIYGHYRPEVFAYLHLIKPGAKAIITTDNGLTFTYTYQNTEAFNPADTSIFTYSGPPRLTIQTCSGAFMQNRQMYYFSYDGVNKGK